MRYTIPLLLASVAATPALADVQVVTDISPIHSLVAQVMGDTGTPDLILPPGSDPHHFQLKPSQAGAIQDADLVIWLGPEMTPWLTAALKARGGEELELLHVDGLTQRQYAEGAHEEHDHDDHDHAHDHEHEHEHEHDHGEGEEHHHHEGLDPHAWLNPDNVLVWLDAIEGKLSEMDPTNAEAYAANAKAAEDDIRALDADLTEQLAPAKGKPFVTFHDAYGYFTDHYDLTSAGAISPGDASSPSARRLAEIREQAGPATCIFPEVQHDPKLAQQMADDAGVTLGQPLDPEGAQLTAGPQLYGQLMHGLADTLTACLK
ncbi:zinc ABC transporter substrate-binding protein [Falsirhodobacter sp. 20TX0035]|uniref:zinc ABC transporter substrate-binding protein n=1 Tax=Falsirhodobacter sp. 20TX0035 TaxID=3022019 RepID=UPI00232D16E7|nr:zinc ABC transporter substrate-binding protein [Falsirhodobacter sp. 20TX0035]MDB6453845.1 zinc ABC transporter substrate-binding protein [Falsirhodobacter sp. 20TX0035]